MSNGATTQDSGFSVRWVSSAEEISSELWSRCFPPPLEGKWWYSALDRSGLDSQFTFAYAVIKKQGESVGIVPTFLMDLQLDDVPRPFLSWLLDILGKFIPGVRTMRVLLIGSPCSEHGIIGLAPGYRLADVAPVLHHALRARARDSGARVIVYKDFPEPASRVLDSMCGRHGLNKLVSYPGTRIPLQAGGFAGHLLALKSSRRYKLRKKLSRSRETVQLLAEVVQHMDPRVADELFGLYWQTYQRGKTKFERLTPQFFRLMANENSCHFVLLRRSDTAKLAAFMLCLHTGSRVINKFVGLDYSLENNAFLYFRLYEHAIDWASRIGASEFHSGPTTYSAKLELGHILFPRTNYFEHLNPLLHRVFAYVARRVSWSSLDDDLKTHLTAHPRALTESIPEPWAVEPTHHDRGSTESRALDSSPE